MLINWFTFAAQVLNFIVLLWLLKRFLYKPILGAVEARETRIATQLASAAAAQAEAQKQSDEFRQKNDDFEKQRAELLDKATKDATAANQQLLDTGKSTADALASSRQQSLEASLKSLNVAVGRRAQDEVFAIARKALTDLGAASLDERIAGVFIDRLNALDPPAKQALGTAIANAHEQAVLRSAFELAQPEQLCLKNAVNIAFSADVPLRFETAPDLIGGIELAANGQKLSWSIAEYLTSLEKGVGELVDAGGKSAPSTATTSDSPNEAKPE